MIYLMLTSNTIHAFKALFIWLVIVSMMLYMLFYAPYSLRLESPRLNQITFILLLTLFSLSLLWFSKKIAGLWRGLLVFISAASLLPILILGAFILVYSGIDENGKDLSFLKIDELQVEQSYYRLYLTGGGATTTNGLVFRKETPLVAGLKLVHHIKTYDSASKGKIEKITPQTARLVVAPNGFGQSKQRYDFHL